MKHLPKLSAAGLASALLAAAVPAARADAVTDWNVLAGDMIVQSRMGTPPAVRVMAIVQTAVHEAVDAVQLLQPEGAAIAADAAVAAANRAALSKLLPQQAAAVTTAYTAALAKLAEGPAKAAAVSAGIAAGEQAAARVIAWRAGDGIAAADAYRPHTTPGAYVPTAGVAAPQWPQRKPWLMQNPAQFRPAPPPALDSALWARDYNEVRAVGSKNSKLRTAEQTEIAKFWEFSLPPIYNGVARSVALMPGRSLAQNARLLAAAGQAMDDALIAVMDAKYHYGFWRPITAIRNGDKDNNPATEIEAGWQPM
ncbi:MAG: PA-phosphatase, partial [Comamonadaceae bacterium]